MQVSQYQTVTTGRLQRLDTTLPGQAVLVLAASLLVAICAHVSLPLLFTPVPLTLGNFAVLLVGLWLGPRLGFVAMIAYLAEGAAGLPVFNPGSFGGIAQLLGPTGGYLLAYPFAAALTGFFASASAWLPNRFVRALLGCSFATALVMVSGFLWLAHFNHLSFQAALLAGLLPFLPGEALKIVIASGLFRTMTRNVAPQH